MSNTHSSEILKLLHVLKYNYKLDFYDYAATSFERRIRSLINQDQLSDVSEIIDNLKTTPEYLSHFLSTITVNVTTLFRNPSCWLALKNEIIASQLPSKKNINVWIAGCSSGEEVYSTTILLHEMGLWNKAIITATDLSPEALAKAKNGLVKKTDFDKFKQSYQAAGGASKLTNYFLEDDKEILFDRKLLKNTTFSQQNLTSSISIHPVDIVICRNVLIYFNQDLQSKVIDEFYRVGTSQSLLFLGQQESLDCLPNSLLYHLKNASEKIYISLKK